MRIESIEVHSVRIPFLRAFAHASKERTCAETIIVLARSPSGTIGVGEIVPRPYLTGETVESVLAESGPRRARRYQGERFSCRDEVVAFLSNELEREEDDLATLGGLELAVLDLAAKELGFSLGEVLGAPPGQPPPYEDPPAGAVIGFDVELAHLKKHCALLRLSGKTHVKIKVGHRDDLERLAIISATLGSDRRLRLDANGAWSARQAILCLDEIRARFAIEWIEQPVPRGDHSGMRQVRLETGLAVMADESLCSLADGRRLIAERAADLFNIRLGKCGGYLGSRRLTELAREEGLGLHLGALVGETAVLSRAAEIFARHVAGFDCLEGKGQNRFLLQGDIATDAVAAGGLGLAVREDWLAQYASHRDIAADAIIEPKETART
jgi:L-alanine-DL-glutamate epimerase-like enolase superfamily enzyme